MFKIIRESFNITNNFIVTATPLIFFSLISGLYLIFSAKGNLLSIAISALLFFLMTGAFLSGWFYMIQRAVKEPDMEKKDSLIFEFPSGVGEYFLSILGLIINTIILSAVIITITIISGKYFIGNAGISSNDLTSAMTSVESMKAFVSSLSNEQLIKINLWNLLLFAGVTINYFIIMFYPSAVYFKNKNPFIALWLSLKDTFGRKFFKNIALFLFVHITYFILSTLTALFGNNIFIHFILTLTNFYYVTFAVILVFNYYYSNFAKVGSEIDTFV